MKIALIIKKLNVRGGTQRQMLSLARELKRLGHAIKLYTLVYDPENCYGELLKDFEVTSASTARQLARLIDQDVDLLNPHDPVAHQVAFYYKKKVRNVPSVWNMNDTESRRWGYDKMRGVDEHFRQPLWKQLGYRLWDRFNVWRFLRYQDAIVVVDDFNRQLARKYLGLAAITVRNGPDLTHFQYQKRISPQGRVKLLTSGIFFPHRRFEDSIMAVKLLREKGHDVTLTIIGDSATDLCYAEKLRRLVKHLALEAEVVFAGKVSEAELLTSYYNHDIYIFQHHLQSDGLSPFEALATGLPVLVSVTAGAHEVLQDRKTALFIEPKNPGAIAGRIEELLQNPALYHKLSVEGQAFVRANFSWQKYATAMLAIFSRYAKTAEACPRVV